MKNYIIQTELREIITKVNIVQESHKIYNQWRMSMSDKQLMSMENKYRMCSPLPFFVQHRIPKEWKLQETIYWSKYKDVLVKALLIKCG
jgi:hypothetical protein